MNNHNNKIGIIIGTRPNLTKIYPFIEFVKKKNLLSFFYFIYTNQHYSNDLIYDLKKITNKKINFIKLRKNKTFKLTNCIDSLIKVFKNLDLNKIIIIGDCDSTLSGAIAAKRLFLKLFHIESGLRSFKNMHEEYNRVVSSSLSDVCFAPSQTSFKYLNHLSKKTNQNVLFTGDLNYENFKIKEKNFSSKHKSDLDKYIIFTLHRRENILVKKKLKKIFLIMNNLAKKYNILFYCHPHTKKNIKKFKIKVNFKIYPSVSNSEILQKIYNSSLVITDSGGIQKEAYYCKKYCVIFRDSSEWVELLKLNSLLSYDLKIILEFIKKYFGTNFSIKKNPYFKKNNLRIALNEILK